MARKKNTPKEDLKTGAAIATVHNDITIANYSDVLHPLDDVLIEKGGGEGLKIYDNIERDGHAYSVLQKRKHQLIGREWVVRPGGEDAIDIKATDFIREQLAALPFDQICLDLLDATLKGFSVVELIYLYDGQHVVVERVGSIDPRRIVFDNEWRPRLLTRAAPTNGQELPERKFMVHRFGVKGNNPYGLGLGPRLFWPVLFKRNGVAYWQRFLERFASPIPVGKHPEGSATQQRELMRTLQQMNHHSAITVPIGTEIETFESSRSGTLDYSSWAKFWNLEMSKATLGETLTTEMGEYGARAASQTHADILEMLIDSDADLLSATLNGQMIAWLVQANFAGARLPQVWRPRPSNEMDQEALAAARAERRSKAMAALQEARDLGFEPEDVEGYMKGVFDGPVRAIKPTAPEAQKKTPELAFSDAGTFSIEDLTDALEESIAKIHEAWIRDIKDLVREATHERALVSAMTKWQTDLPAPAYIEPLGDAIALAEIKGRAEVIDEIDGPELAEPAIGTVRFKEAQEFLRQKVSLPSKVWTETLHRAHDRAFVVAGADAVALVEDLRGALDKALDGGGGLEGFRKRFDEIVLAHGWQYNGGRNWRTRVIYETNLRTAHQAGRLKQMRDPDVVKARPYWRYVHAEIRKPKMPREQHQAWDGLVLPHDDPIWERIYPPNGWKCSCSVVTVSEAGLKRLGKDGPDKAPKLNMRSVTDPTTGERIRVPEGIDFGWGYQPGDTWERGLVPRELQKPLALVQPELPLPVSPPLGDLGRPFAAPALPTGKAPEYYVERFLSRFGGAIGRGVMYRDQAGQAVLVSDALFRKADGSWKALKRGREVQLERLAEAIFDPDEIWVDWGELPNGNRRLVRRYLRWDPELAAFSLFEWSLKGWSGVTSFDPKTRSGRARLSYLEKSRRGALLYRRGS